MEREEMLSELYAQFDEDDRLCKSRQGQLEYFITMHYIHKFLKRGDRVLEIGAGTGRYSIALAKEGMRVSAVELVEENLAVLRENSRGMDNIESFRGDAVDLGRFADNTFDVTLVLGPMYHIYEPKDVNSAIDEAIRVTKPGGVILFAFISVFGIMYANYFQGNWAAGQEENFDADYRIRHFKEQLFTGYDVGEFEALFSGKPVDHITTAGTSGMLEAIEARPDFEISDADFAAFSKWHLQFAEKRELLGCSNHLLYITASMKNLKAFLKCRDSLAVFDPCRAEGSVGIPAIVKENGGVTLDWEGYLSELGLPVVYREDRPICRLDGKGC